MVGIDLPGGLFGKEEIDDDSGAPLSDWKGIINKGTVRIIDSSTTNATSTFYVVPAGKHFYLVSAQLFGQIWAAGTIMTGFFMINASDDKVLRVRPYGANDTQMAIMNFPTPLRFNPSTPFKVYSSSANTTAYIHIMGYEI